MFGCTRTGRNILHPRTMRELEALPEDEATKIWEALSGEEKVKLMNAMTTEEIEAMPKRNRDAMREMTCTTLKRALGELEAVEATDGKFIYNGDGADPFELDKEYCTTQLTRLKKNFEGQTEESLGFYGYHNLRLWIDAYTFLLNEINKKAGNP